MGFKQRIWADLKRLPAVRYVLGIFNVKPLSLLQIYSRYPNPESMTAINPIEPCNGFNNLVRAVALLG
jgi:hypothetical protein